MSRRPLVRLAVILALALAPAARAESGTGDLIQRVAAAYPEAARTANVEGDVTATLFVDPAGAVRKVRIDAEQPAGYGFGLAATQAFWRWRYKAGGPPERQVTLNFRHPRPFVLAELATFPAAPAPLKAVTPFYPSRARREGIDGHVDFALVIGPDGRIDRAEIVTEKPVDTGFGFFAAAALRRTFFPAGRAGLYRLRYTFAHAAAPPAPAIDPARILRTTERRTLTPFVLTKEARRQLESDATARVLVLLDETGRLLAIAADQESPAGLGVGEGAIDYLEEMDFDAARPGVYAIPILIRKP